MRKIILTAALLIAASPAQAAITIGALSQLCGFDANGRERAPSAHASCQSYIAGIVDYHDLFKSVGKTTTNVDFCLPPNLTYTDIQRIVLEYLQSHAGFKDSPASSAVVLALHNGFPCGGGFGASADYNGDGLVNDPTAPTGDVQSGIPQDTSGNLAAPDMDDMSGM